MKTGRVRFFRSRAAFRDWLEAHHGADEEIWVGFWKAGSGRTGCTYPEAVLEALCFGWIDGIRKSLDERSYTNRFTPRRRGSNWSALNIRHVRRLVAEGRMHEAGIAAFEARKTSRRPSRPRPARRRR